MAEFETLGEMIERLSFKTLNDFSSYAGPDFDGWVVAYTKSRDSDVLARCNFDVMLDRLGGEIDGKVQVIRQGHWLVGWIEHVMVHESAKKQLKILLEIRNQLEDYPIIDEDAFSEAESREQDETYDLYKTEFIKNMAKYLGIQLEMLSPANLAEFESAVCDLFHADCAYRGTEDGFVCEEHLDSLYQINDFENRYIKLISDKYNASKAKPNKPKLHSI